MFFSLTFFFNDVITLSYLAKNVSDMVMPGGYFIGTVMDGSKVKPYLAKNEKLVLGKVTIEREYDGEVDTSPYGEKITYVYRGSQTVAEKQVEYLVDMNALSEAMKLNGFEVVEITPFPASRDLDEDEKVLNSFYTSFAYRKMSS
jgi:hypothetical protein